MRRKTVAFVSGVWDLLHVGHLEMLEFAAGLADELVVSVGADATVRAIKREPKICEHDRWRMVSSMRCVTRAFVARGEPSHRDCLYAVRTLRPDVWVLGDDDPHAGEKRELARELGCRIVVWNRPGSQFISTTKIIQQICETEEEFRVRAVKE